MARRRSRVPLDVYINSRLVGQLRRLPSGAIDFQYDEGWLSWEHALPVSFSLPLREDRYTGDPVIAVFENLLPDNLHIRRRIAERIKADGHDTLELLKASNDPAADQTIFLRAQIVFWLLGATDGHAKNFSIFLQPGGRFSLTPLYDVMSSQPAMDAGQLRRNQFRLAHRVGNSRQYVIDQIMARHFVQTAENSGLRAAVVEQIYADLAESAETAIDETLAALPDGFPVNLADSIVGGMQARLRRIT